MKNHPACKEFKTDTQARAGSFAKKTMKIVILFLNCFTMVNSADPDEMPLGSHCHDDRVPTEIQKHNSMIFP